MIETTDPLDRLRAANPVPAAELSLIEADAVLFQRIVAGAAPAGPLPAGAMGPRRRRVRGRRLVPALAASAVFGGAVAYAVARGEVSRPETVACFERVDLAAATAAASVGEAGAVEACAGVWRRGEFGASTAVPPLVACVLPSGVAGVFPAPAGADPCTRLNLVPVEPAPAPATPSTTGPAPAPAVDVGTRVIGFRDAVVGEFLASTCVTPEAGDAIVRRELDRAALGDWSVVQGPAGPDRPCVTVSVRSEERQVVLVPSPARR